MYKFKVTVKEGMDTHFKYAVRAFCAESVINPDGSDYEVETKMSLADISGLTTVKSVREIIVQEERSDAYDDTYYQSLGLKKDLDRNGRVYSLDSGRQAGKDAADLILGNNLQHKRNGRSYSPEAVKKAWDEYYQGKNAIPMHSPTNIKFRSAINANDLSLSAKELKEIGAGDCFTVPSGYNLQSIDLSNVLKNQLHPEYGEVSVDGGLTVTVRGNSIAWRGTLEMVKDLDTLKQADDLIQKYKPTSIGFKS